MSGLDCFLSDNCDCVDCMKKEPHYSDKDKKNLTALYYRVFEKKGLDEFL